LTSLQKSPHFDEKKKPNTMTLISSVSGKNKFYLKLFITSENTICLVIKLIFLGDITHML
jgi:hypothetical protein